MNFHYCLFLFKAGFSFQCISFDFYIKKYRNVCKYQENTLFPIEFRLNSRLIWVIYIFQPLSLIPHSIKSHSKWKNIIRSTPEISRNCTANQKNHELFAIRKRNELIMNESENSSRPQRIRNFIFLCYDWKFNERF